MMRIQSLILWPGGVDDVTKMNAAAMETMASEIALHFLAA